MKLEEFVIKVGLKHLSSDYMPEIEELYNSLGGENLNSEKINNYRKAINFGFKIEGSTKVREFTKLFEEIYYSQQFYKRHSINPKNYT